MDPMHIIERARDAHVGDPRAGRDDGLFQTNIRPLLDNAGYICHVLPVCNRLAQAMFRARWEICHAVAIGARANRDRIPGRQPSAKHLQRLREEE